MAFNPEAYFLIHQKQQKQHISLSIKATPFGCGCRDQLCDQPLNTHIFNYIIGPKHKSNVKTNCPKKYIVGSKHKCQDKTCFIYFYTTGLGVTFDLVFFLHCILRKCLFLPGGRGRGNLGDARKKTFFSGGLPLDWLVFYPSSPHISLHLTLFCMNFLFLRRLSSFSLNHSRNAF